MAGSVLKYNIIMLRMNRILSTLLVLVLMLGFHGCQQQLSSNARTPKYVYHAGYTPKKLRSGKVTVPYKAPARIKKAIAAGNKIVGKPIRSLAPDLQRLAERCELTIEMGRFFASECGTYLTEVIDTKVNCGSRFAILDGGMHHVNYLGGMMGMRVPVITHIAGLQHADETEADWSLCGSLCTTADVLVRKITLSGLAMGDVLAFHNIGAYSVTEGPALFLSRNMPRIILANDDGARLVRDVIHSSAINQSNINK